MEFRQYQNEIDDAINESLIKNDKCLVKAFCGTGKSIVMYKGKAFQNHDLLVYVFPSLSLIDQFKTDYLKSTKVLIISSDDDSTTDESTIKRYMKNKNKIICITYQSFHLLTPYKINMCVFDEAHHAVGETYQKLIFNPNIEKSCFFTATPKCANGIDMVKDCNLVFEYSYLRGLSEGYLNPFEIRCDLVGDDSNKTIYESIARAYYTTGNNRILTFHSDVNTESPTSVRNFVNENEMNKAFKTIAKEFSKDSKKVKLPKIKMLGFYSEIKLKERRQILNEFDSCKDVFILSSCETMGEGVDTKNANMCVFVDSKTSITKIIQNIGRVVRKVFGINKPYSTILLPMTINKSKYESCQTAEECDALIRQDMNKDGHNDFTSILNVLSALKQEDEDLYDICLHYPNEYSPQEIEENLKSQGYEIGEEVELDEVFERANINESDIEEDEENQENYRLDIHTNSLEEPIVSHGSGDKIINILKDGDNYYEIGEGQINPPKQRIRLSVHTNSDIKVLWKVDEINFGSCLLDCEVVDNWNERLEELRTFLEREKQIPNRNKEDEKQLAQWVNDQKVRYKKGIMQPHKKVIWETFTKQFELYFKSLFDKWYESLKYLKEYIDIYKKLPDIKNKKLQKWLFDQDQKYKYDKLKDEIYDEWIKFLIEYKPYFKSTDEIWIVKMDEYKDFVKKNDKKPSSNAPDINERSLSYWSLRNLTLFKDFNYQKLYENRYSIWKEFTELYSIQSKEDSWYKNLDNCCNFIDIYKRRPCDSSKDANEKKIGKWLVNTITNYNMKRKAMKFTETYQKFKDFLQKYKSYLKTNIDLWYEKFERIKQFIEMYKRRPHEKSKDVNEDELGSWLQTQMNSFKTHNHIMKEKEIYKIWKKFIEDNEELLKTQLEKYNDDWNEKLQQCIEYIKLNKKRPKRSDPLGVWLKNQVSCYNTTNPARQLNEKKHEIFKQFIEKYLTKKTMKFQAKTESEIKEPKEKEQKRERVDSEISELHKEYKTKSSKHLHEEFQEDPEKWHHYHEIAEANEETFPSESIPRNQIIQELEKIKTKRPKQVIDMGCGKAFISKHFEGDTRFKFTNIDHVAIDETVQSGDISKLSFEDDSVEICILSLAMWGSNCKEYISQAHRVLETNGTLYIIEPTKRWTNEIPADRLRELLQDFTIKKEIIEKFTMFVAIKN